MCNKSVKVKKITVNMSRKSKFAWAFLLSLRALFIYSPVGEIFTGRGGSDAVMHTLRDSLARMFSRAE